MKSDNRLDHHYPVSPAHPEQVHHYLPIPDDIARCGFYITSLGHSTIAPHTVYPPVQHPSLYHFQWAEGRVLPEFSLGIITAGSGIFESRETDRLALSPGMAFLLFPGVWHRYRPDSETGWTETWMQFNGAFADLLIQQQVISPQHAILRGAHLVEAAAAIRRLLASVHAAPSANTFLISLQGLGVLSQVLSPPAPVDQSPVSKETDPVVSAALEYIWSRSHEVLSAAAVAEAVGIQRRTLERHMIQNTGRSLLDAIIDCRFSRAERLLRETDIPMKNIVTRSGFGSLQNMRYVFLQRAKCSLTEFRNRYRSGEAVPLPYGMS